MQPIEQTRFTPEEGGNCYAACIASILECSLDEVPQLNGDEGLTEEGYSAYRDRLYDWLRQRNLDPLYFEAGREWVPRGYAVLAVRSPRFPELEHAVVARDGEVIWDPHPSRDRWAELGQERIGYTIFQMLDPARKAFE